jgi:phage/plasmid-associated DNA primase
MLIETYNEFIKGAEKIQKPPCVIESTNEYLDDNNPVINWIKNFITITNNKNDIIKAGELYDMFVEDTNDNSVKAKYFGQLMRTNNIDKKRTNSGYVYVGIKHNEEVPATPAEPPKKKCMFD